jgi:hypothetical protein
VNGAPSHGISRVKAVGTALRVSLFFLCAFTAIEGCALAQTLTQRGFVEMRTMIFPLDTPIDGQHIVIDLVGREEAFVTPAPWIQLAAGVDVRGNSHDQVADSWRPDFSDRGLLRPPLSIRRLSATLSQGAVTLDVGRQFIRWGKTDIVTPTDRFAPRDFLNVVDSEFLGVTGARVAVQQRADAVEVAWVPVFTPSRIPLLNQRWSPVPLAVASGELQQAAADFPGRSQAGVRWGHTGRGYEFDFSLFDGFNHLPDVEFRQIPGTVGLEILPKYPRLRTYGGDAALPTQWFTAKGEAAYFTSPDQNSDEYVLYVIQLERQSGEWLMMAGYAGEVVTERRVVASFAPDRGLTRSIVASASYTIDPSRSATVEAAVRQNGDGAYAKGEYSWTRGQHWRTTVTGVLLAGAIDDFLGQYRRNSHLALTLRYSF